MRTVGLLLLLHALMTFVTMVTARRVDSDDDDSVGKRFWRET